METTNTTTSKSYTLRTETPPPAEYGWVCPRCNRVNAPWKSTCDCVANNWQVNWGKTTADHENWWKTYITCTQADTKVGGYDYYDSNTGTYHN